MKIGFPNCNTRLCVFTTVILSFFWFSTAFAEEIYISQTATGGNTGTDCANAHSMAWLNTTGNWGAGAGKVSAGDTVHLCGTLASSLAIGGSGSAGNPITILFEFGAKFSNSYWNPGAIIGGSNNYIVIDGGTNGIIECTDNGTPGTYTYQNESRGIWFDASPVNDIEIKNLKIQNMYIRNSITDYSANAYNSIGFAFHGGAVSNISVHDCTFIKCTKVGLIYFNSGNRSNYYFYNNTASGFHTGLMVGDTASNSHLTGLYFYGNNMNYGTDYTQGDNTDRFHGDILHTWSQQGGSTIDTVYIYNNFLGPTMPHRLSNSPLTSYIYLTDYVSNILIYNNVLAATTGQTFGPPGYIALSGGNSNQKVYNNTIIGANNGGNTAIQSTNGTLEVKNNIIMNVAYGITDGTTGNYPSNTTADYNVYGIALDLNHADTGAHSHHGTDPTLNSNYALMSSDTLARDKGIDLGVYFTKDKNGVLRPQGSAWDIGAFEFDASKINPPQHLNIVQ
jgi:hypothetical protein